MRIFHIHGISGLLLFGVAALLAIAAAIALPVGFVLVLWNATVYEAFGGPLIHFQQAALLTAALAILFKAIFNPQIAVQFRRVSDPAHLDALLKQAKNPQDENE